MGAKANITLGLAQQQIPLSYKHTHILVLDVL